MIVSVLALSALALQRVQNRMLTGSSDVRQAQQNAEAAIGLGLLAIKNDANWRTTYANGSWFSNRNLGNGTCSLTVTDPDSSLADDPTDSIVMTGVGTAGGAEQRIVRTVDAVAEPLQCLQSSVAAGDSIGLAGGSVLRASNSGLITANSSSVSGSTVYGRVKAVTVSGSTYSGTTAQVAAADRPTMPDWSTVFDYYRTNGTRIPVGNLLSSLPNMGRNINMGNGTTDWIGDAPGVGQTATLTSASPSHTGANNSILVTARSGGYAGASQRIDSYVKPGQAYDVEAWVYCSIGSLPLSRNFGISCYTKGTGNASPLIDGGPSWPNQSPTVLALGMWAKISATVTAPAWSGNLEYAFIKFASSDGNTGNFYLDDVTIRDNTTGKFIYRSVIGPGYNSLGTANPQGLYWIDCAGNKIIIERSRIKGTLLLVNPGSGSMIGAGPINWSPATPGYPALLVDADTAANADFAIAATNRALSEAEDGVNYNPAGVSHETLGTDSDMNDTYPSEIQGLILVEDDLAFQNNALVRGSVITGGDVTSSGGSLEVVYRPDALYSPPPGLTGTFRAVGRPLSVRKVVGP
jgi:Carbohydrate binding domain